jgi:mRNA-degrading endonuclease RelE of RelBE toxin-antitoxin system
MTPTETQFVADEAGVGRHRVIYEVEDTARVVTVLAVGHRKDIYG